jgi:hypothetical protein
MVLLQSLSVIGVNPTFVVRWHTIGDIPGHASLSTTDLSLSSSSGM